MTDDDELDDSNDAERAFDRLRREVALTLAAVKGIAAGRNEIEIPDYSETLAQIQDTQGKIRREIAFIANAPALKTSVADWGSEMARSSASARSEDHRALLDARSAFERAAKDVGMMLGSAREAARQENWLIWSGVAGMVLGAAIAVGTNMLWHGIEDQFRSPEQHAADVLGMDQMDAGVHLIQAASPAVWQDLLLGGQIVAKNRALIRRCQKFARQKDVRCLLRIPATKAGAARSPGTTAARGHH